MAKKQEEDYGKSLQEAYDRWAHLYEHGGSDPFYSDGGNMNLVRNHILYYRSKIEEKPSLLGYPAAYYKDIPPEVDRDYMARADEIRAAARVSLDRYKADPNYQYIVQHYEDYTPKTRNKIHLDNIIGYAKGLEIHIKDDDLVGMRRHERAENYLPAFESCAQKMKAMPIEVNQQSMFSILNNSQPETADDSLDDDGSEEFDEPDFSSFDEENSDEDADETDEPDTEADSGIVTETESGGIAEQHNEDANNKTAAPEAEPPPRTEPLRITKSEWEKIGKDYKGEWTRSTWEFRGGDFPESWIGRKTVIEQALPDSVFERSGRKKDYGHGSMLITEGNAFEIVPDEIITGRRDESGAVQSTGIAAQPIKAMSYDNIPDELKSLNQWTVFRTYPDKEKIGQLNKVIISPVNSSFAHIDMPETWASYAQAKAYAERYRHYKGLVFALSGGITFIDIDHAIKDGEIVSTQAKRLMELLPDTYTEKSTSGTGIHILLKGSLPDDTYRRNDRKGIEMYDNRRFICMTGDTINGSREIKDYSDRIARIARTFAGQRPPRNEYTATPATQSDTELITQITSSRQGAKFQTLYRGDTSGYPSHSHAESALVFTLAWWTQNPTQIDSIIRSSGLIRSKWDERRGNGTYGSQLIDEALSTVTPRQELKPQQNYL